jgi:hypothetical protein
LERHTQKPSLYPKPTLSMSPVDIRLSDLDTVDNIRFGYSDSFRNASQRDACPQPATILKTNIIYTVSRSESLISTGDIDSVSFGYSDGFWVCISKNPNRPLR